MEKLSLAAWPDRYFCLLCAGADMKPRETTIAYCLFRFRRGTEIGKGTTFWLPKSFRGTGFGGDRNFCYRAMIL